MKAAALALQVLQARCSALLANRAFVSAESHLLPATSRATAVHQLLSSTGSQLTCSSSISSPAWSFASMRHMAGRTHKLSLKRANNKASWAAVRPFLQQQPQQAVSQQPSPAEKPAPIQTALPELPKLEEPPHYRRIGCITGPYTIRNQAAFAVLESGGSQFKVTTDDVIYHNKIPNVLVNDVLEFGKVLMVGTQQETTIGRPFIPGATVIAAVEETLKDAKVHVFKKKKRKGYSKLFGHRSQITALRILELRAPGQQLPAASSSSGSSSSMQQAAAAAAPAAAAAAATIGVAGKLHGPPAIQGITGIGPQAAAARSGSSSSSRGSSSSSSSSSNNSRGSSSSSSQRGSQT